MEIQDYLVPTDIGEFKKREHLLAQNRTRFSAKELNKLEETDVAILGIPYQGMDLEYTDAPDRIRKELFELIDFSQGALKILDLGNVKKGKTFNDTLVGLRDVIAYIIEKEIFTILLGGTGLLKSSVLHALFSSNQTTNMVAVDPFLSMYSESALLKEGFADNLCLDTIGTQSYYLTAPHLEWMDKHSYRNYGLGQIRNNILNIEPVFRDSDFTAVSINAIKHSDAPAQEKPMPNGFYGEEISQLARFIGMADNTKVFGLFDLFTENDISNKSSHLAAQISWFVMEGFYNRVVENPAGDKNMKKFIVNQDNPAYELIFYKSECTDRWWMEIPSQNYESSRIYSCSYEDYLRACDQDLPKRWLDKFQRHNLESPE